jgi:hypothetical protein
MNLFLGRGIQREQDEAFRASRAICRASDRFPWYCQVEDSSRDESNLFSFTHLPQLEPGDADIASFWASALVDDILSC